MRKFDIGEPRLFLPGCFRFFKREAIDGASNGEEIDKERGRELAADSLLQLEKDCEGREENNYN
ncbi:hypothetical protein M5K25_003146 [Dendrobium thyrsiflorum]|uniref:Uncharacterized protein n=1 Tax=Dendrobium thyrsiflorum TaxID=117978 RepID=A0ABD0VYI8_DENTH